MGDVYFAFPQAAYLFLFLIPMIGGMYALHRYRKRKMQLYADAFHLPLLMNPRSILITHFKNACLVMAWILIVLAFMNPKGNIKYAPSAVATEDSTISKRKAHEVVLLVDTSASMGVSDGRNDETRLENAKDIAGELIGRLNGQTISLYAFTSALTRLVPPTYDYLFTRLVIKNLQINEGEIGGTNLKTILSDLKEKIFSQSLAKLYTFIIISDGGDNELEKLQGVARQQRINEIANIFSNAHEIQLRIFTVGTGSTLGGIVPNVTLNGQTVTSKLDADVLKQLALIGRGEYFGANDYDAWNLARQIGDKIDQDSPFDKSSDTRVVIPPSPEEISSDRYYQLPLGLALLLLLIVFVLPDTQGYVRFFMFIIVLIPSLGSCQEDINRVGLKAEAHFGARDFEQAATLYDRLLKGNVPDWQRALILYNLATVHLAQGRSQEALTFYRAISLNAISSPQLVKYLAFNQGILYLLQAKHSDDAEQSLYYLQQSERFLEETKQIECLQKTDCQPSEDLTQALEAVSIQTNQAWRQEREQLAKEGKNMIRFLLVKALEHLIEILNETGRSDLKKEYMAYAVSSANQLSSLWEEAKDQDEAHKEYVAGVALLEAGKLEEAQMQMKKVLGILSQRGEEIDRLFVQFYLILTERHLNQTEMERLISEMKKHSLESPLASAEMSLTQLKNGYQAAARFFFLHSFITFEASISQNEKVTTTPKSILKRSLRNARWALQFNRLIQIEKVNEQQIDILKNAQDTVVSQANDFIPAVVEMERKAEGCQAQPWALAIPLFEKGYEAALMAQRDLERDTTSILLLQEQTITYWQQALQIIENPPQSEGQQQNQETIRSLEEMEAQDKIPAGQSNQELHSW